jgi:hypothetical protein
MNAVFDLSLKSSAIHIPRVDNMINKSELRQLISAIFVNYFYITNFINDGEDKRYR